METGLIIYGVMMGIAVVFAISEYSISKLKDESRLKKWWRRYVVTDWSNHKKTL